MTPGATKTLYSAFAILMLLLLATIVLNFVPLGGGHIWIGLAIAAIKATLVMVIFMGVGRSTNAVRLAAGSGVLWLTFAISLAMADYLTRGWDETQGDELRASNHYTSFDRVNYPPQQ